MRPLRWRIGVVVSSTILIIGYCVGLMVHVHYSPDIGLHCTFSPTVARVFPEYLRYPFDSSYPEVVGCTIQQLGPHPIESWPQFLRAIRDVRTDSQPVAIDPTLLDRDGERWVRVQLQRTAEEPPFAIWCVVGRTPLETTLPALIWLILEIGLFSVGALVFWKQPGDRAAGPFFALTIVAVGAYLGGYHWWQVVTQPLLLIVFVMSAVLVPAVTLHFHHVFPRTKPWLQRYRWPTFAAIYVIPIVMGLMVIGVSFWVRYLFRSGATSLEIHDAMGLVRTCIFASCGVAALWYLAGTICLAHSFRRADQPGERQQVKWILSDRFWR